MATTTAPNHRASLLSGLRTGGVRSTSATIPHTAAPGATFNIPRFASASYGSNGAHAIGEEEDYDDDDQLADIVAHKMHLSNAHAPPRMQMQQPPLTAAVDGSYNRFAQQQQQGAPRGYGHGVGNAHLHAQAQQQQALQMQMMQLEMLRLQALQAQQQQYQAELLAQAQFQQHQQQQHLRSGGYHHPPATAGPLATSFGAAQLRRPSQAELLRYQLGVDEQQQVPMTAALNGKFGGRLHISGEDEFPGSRHGSGSPQTPTAYTGVISGGASLGGNGMGNGNGNGGGMQPSKSDAAVSWRRANTNNSVLRRSPPPIMPDVRITPPPIDTDISPSASAPTARARPSPLRFSPPSSAIAVAISGANDESEDGSASEASSDKSSPATPQSSAGSGYAPPLSPREDAAKKLYDGLGLGKPSPATINVSPAVNIAPAITVAAPVTASIYASAAAARASGPTRQPRGPPAGTDELGPRNFAARIRKQAIGGLGALLESRERREPAVDAL